VKSSDAAQHADMITSARQNDLLTNTSERSSASFYQLMMYESLDSTNIFTPANVQAMCQFESSFANFKMAADDSESIATTAPPNWLDSDYCPAELNFKDYCLLDQSTGNCSTPESGAIWSGSLSVVNLVYTLAQTLGTSSQALVKANGEWDCSLLEESDVELVSNYLIEQMSSTDGQGVFELSSGVLFCLHISVDESLLMRELFRLYTSSFSSKSLLFSFSTSIS